MSSRGLKYTFNIGELVLCFEPDPTKAKVLYDAKVLDLQSLKDKDGKKIPGYHIHFQGWNSSWDRIVSEEFILKNTVENRLLMKKLAETAKRNQSKGNRTRKIDEILKRFDNEELSNDEEKDDDEDDSSKVESEQDEESSEESDSENKDSPVPDIPADPKQPTHNPVEIVLPDVLKHRLEDDYYSIHHKDKLVKLPVKPNVVDILESFVKNYCFNLLSEPQERDKSRSNSSDSWHHAPGRWIPLCKEMVDGIRICFDFTLPVLLLYNEEKEQYNEMKNISPESLSNSHSSYEPEAKKPKIQSPARPSPIDSDSESSSDDISIRRITRRSIHEEAPKTNPRGRKSGARSRRIVSTPPEIKTEPNSDNEISFNLNVQSQSSNVFSNSHPTTSNGNGCHPIHDDHRSEMIDNLLSWKLVPQDVQNQTPIQPSQIYGVHHLLRLFVKLPCLVNKMNIDQPRTDILMKLVDSFLQYIVDREDLFQEECYIDT